MNEAPRRRTRQRSLILEIVREHQMHPTAEEIYDIVRLTLPRTSLSTVYRNLSVLVDQDEIMAVKSSGGEVHYDGCTGDHCHFSCVECGKLYDMEMDGEYSTELKPRNCEGFVVERTCICFSGICADCGKIEMNSKEEE